MLADICPLEEEKLKMELAKTFGKGSDQVKMEDSKTQDKDLAMEVSKIKAVQGKLAKKLRGHTERNWGLTGNRSELPH